MNETPKIRILGLHVAFGDNKVLRGLDLDVGAAESVVIIGGSGVGKSVLLKCILGLIDPDPKLGRRLAARSSSSFEIGSFHAKNCCRSDISVIGIAAKANRCTPIGVF